MSIPCSPATRAICVDPACSKGCRHVEERRQRGEPYSVPHASVKTDRWFLTNLEWHPNHIVDVAQYETGVQDVSDEQIIPDTFRLIQHGWRDFKAANAVILRALEKGWDAYRIWQVMDFMTSRKVRPVLLVKVTGTINGESEHG